MAEVRKNVLIAGLGKFVGADLEAATKFGPPALMKQKLKEDLENSRIAGYDCSQIDVDPDHPDVAVSEIKEKLQSQHWDLFVIGFGIRGNKAFTSLFDEAVNSCVELSPGTRFGFSPAPDAVFRTILRVLPPSS